MLVVVDASQIEARFLVTWAEQWDVVSQFANHEDVYANFAKTIFDMEEVNKADHPMAEQEGDADDLGHGFLFSTLRFQLLENASNPPHVRLRHRPRR